MGEGAIVEGRLSGGLRDMILVTLPLVLSKPSNSTSRYDGLRGTCPTTYGRPFNVVAGFHVFLELENRDGSRRRRPLPDSVSCCLYSSGTNSSKRIRVVVVRGSVVPETVPLDKGSDLKSTCDVWSEGNRASGGNGVDATTHESPIAISLDILGPLGIQPTAAINEITEHIQEGFFDNFFSAHDWLGVPPERWESLLRFLELAIPFGRLIWPLGNSIGYRRTEL